MTAGTSMGLNKTIIGVAMTRAMTVPVKMRPESINRAVPMVEAVRNLTVWRVVWVIGCCWWYWCCICCS